MLFYIEIVLQTCVTFSKNAFYGLNLILYTTKQKQQLFKGVFSYLTLRHMYLQTPSIDLYCLGDELFRANRILIEF